MIRAGALKPARLLQWSAAIAALWTAAACYGTGLEARCRRGIATCARATVERCCSAAIGVEPTLPTA